MPGLLCLEWDARERGNMTRHRRQSKLELAIKWREWKRLEQFPGAIRRRQMGSEIEMMQSLNPAERRERLRNSMKTVFRLRLRGWPEIGSLIFS